ncbi:ExbD/TolR family protein [Aliikangiella sp. IMCC44359]|uniref:ExbD/TolR family protein n=1 Tax=Aliikangiella sp. IMCC44359 TaxID=3459125 RepID=UPI00403AF131
MTNDLETYNQTQQQKRDCCAERYALKNMKKIFIIVGLLLLASCSEDRQYLTITMDDGKVYLNSKVVTDLENALNSASCSNEEKVVLRAKKGVSFQELEQVLKQISNAGCKEQLELERMKNNA